MMVEKKRRRSFSCMTNIQWVFMGAMGGAVMATLFLGEIALFGYDSWFTRVSVQPSLSSMHEIHQDAEGKKDKIDPVLFLDEASVRAAHATMWAVSTTAWEKTSNDTPPESVALAATIDRRPVTWRRRVKAWLDSPYLLGSNENTNKFNATQPNSVPPSNMTLGCCFSTFVMVDQLSKTIPDSFQKLQGRTQCILRFQFSNRRFALAFAAALGIQSPGVAIDKHGSIVRVFGKGRAIQSSNLNFQYKKNQFPGFPWNVDCEFPNGVPSLKCEELSRISVDDLQTVSLETVFHLEKAQNNQIFCVSSSWPLAALQTHNDNVHEIARTISMHANDTSSAFVPSSSLELSLALGEGPVYTMDTVDGRSSLLSTQLNPQSIGGAHPRLATNLIQQARQAPHSTRIIGVADGQVLATMAQVKRILSLSLEELSHSCSDALYDLMSGEMPPDVNTKGSEKLRPFSCHLRNTTSINRPIKTLSDLLRKNGIRIQVVAFPLTSWAFESMPIAGQYGFDVWLTARYAADYHVLMYFDGDALPLVRDSQSGRLQNIFYNHFFNPLTKRLCNAKSFRLIEQSLPAAKSSTEKELNCISTLLDDATRRQAVLKNCDIAHGNLAARTDAILALNVHRTITDEKDLPGGIEDCAVFRQGAWLTFFPTEEAIELHLTSKTRPPICTCSTDD